VKAAVLRAVGGPLLIEDVPTPEPGPGEVLLRVRACGAGLTIQHIVSGVTTTKLPIIPGHEIAGEVVGLGPGTDGIPIDQRVTVHFSLFCGRCTWCLRGLEPLCDHTAGNIGRTRDGGYAEFVSVPARNLVFLPEGLDYENNPGEVAVICDAIATPVKVCRRARLEALETCVVFGAAGGVGLHMVKVARFWGARVIAVDKGTRKLDAAVDAGAHEAVDVLQEEPSEAVRRLTGGQGADVVVDLVVTDETLASGTAGLRKRGRFVILGMNPDASVVVDPVRWLRDELELLGSRYVSRHEVMEALELVRRGWVVPTVSRVFSLADVNDAHDLLAKGEAVGRLAIVP
jgi:propanol-preferring alcohol dehydrogenase